RLDVLSEFDEIPIAVRYKLRGEEIDTAPEDPTLLSECEVVHETMPG
ncbi:MAG: adenylosuccinate synthetase, partial [Candidatus Omnitrophica bacterium]|nr:adenylosuccinate synthetase [Candidatus Omnitrophota bacterium]